MESKYRYRNISDFEVTGLTIPEDAKDRKSEYRRQGFGMKKVNDVWEWVKYKDSQRSENPDIADVYNTVLKMSQKRALIATTLNVLAASDMFTQDIDEDPTIITTPHGDVNKKTGEILEEDKNKSKPNSNSTSKNNQTPNSNTNQSNGNDILTPEQSYRGLMNNIDKLIENKGGYTEQQIVDKLKVYRTSWISKNHPEVTFKDGLREIDSFLAQLGHPIKEVNFE